MDVGYSSAVLTDRDGAEALLILESIDDNDSLRVIAVQENGNWSGILTGDEAAELAKDSSSRSSKEFRNVLVNSLKEGNKKGIRVEISVRKPDLQIKWIQTSEDELDFEFCTMRLHPSSGVDVSIWRFMLSAAQQKHDFEIHSAQWAKEKKILTERMKILEEQMANYAAERSEIETRLLSAFVPILNEKKAKIRRLREDLAAAREHLNDDK